jgi:hypothetical protein
MNTKEEKAIADDLKAIVSQWVDRSFNFIDLANAEKVHDDMLFEYIEGNQTEETAQEFLSQYGYVEEFEKSKYESHLEFVQDTYEDEFTEFAEQDHYPMWSTLFEFRSAPSEEILEAARKAGFGIISGSDHYETMLFVKGAGYSFYGAHWIPMYLNLPWVDAGRYKDLDYSSM